jgi:hypothetical protein
MTYDVLLDMVLVCGAGVELVAIITVIQLVKPEKEVVS